jgi:hypothetical protein
MDREYSDGNLSREEHRNKSKERRYERALRVKSIQDLTLEEGMDPDDYANIVDDELLELQNANV